MGSQALNLGGTLANIQAAITLTNASGKSTLSLDDSADVVAQTGTINPTEITGLGMGSNAAIIYNTDDTSDLKVLQSVTVHTGMGGAAVSVSGASVPIALIGKGTANTLVGPNSDATWDVTGSNEGSIAALGLTFTQFQSLTGGSGADTFAFEAGAHLAGTIDGGGGTNTLDYSAGWTGNVVVNLQTGRASGVQGGVANIQNVTGAGGGSTTAYDILVGNGGNVLAGGDGRDNLLIAGSSASTLQGGDMDDILIGGTTAYDTQLSDQAMIAIMKFWTTTSGSYQKSVAKLLAGKGVPALNASVVSDNGGSNTMLGHNGGTTELNLYYGLGPIEETTDYDPAAGEQFIDV